MTPPIATDAFSARRDGVETPGSHVPPTSGRTGVAGADGEGVTLATPGEADALARPAAVADGPVEGNAVAVGPAHAATTAVANNRVAARRGVLVIVPVYRSSPARVQARGRVGPAA